MKLQPQFNLRFRDAEQFELVMDEAERDGISMNEWVLRGLEGFYVVLKRQRVMAERKAKENDAGVGKLEIHAGQYPRNHKNPQDTDATGGEASA